MEITKLMITFLIWFLSWTLLESLMQYYKISTVSKIKLVSICAVGAWSYYYYTYSKDTSELNE